MGTGRGRERDLRSDPSQRAMRADGCRPACEPTRRVTLRARAAPAPAVKRQPGPAAAAAPAVHTLLDPPADGLCSCVSLSLSLPPRLLLRSPSSCMFYPSLFLSPPILLLFSPPPPSISPVAGAHCALPPAQPQSGRGPKASSPALCRPLSRACGLRRLLALAGASCAVPIHESRAPAGDAPVSCCGASSLRASTAVCARPQARCCPRSGAGPSAPRCPRTRAAGAAHGQGEAPAI